MTGALEHVACLGESRLSQLKWTMALDQTYFQQGWLTLVKLCIGPKQGQPRTPGIDFFVQCPGLIFLASRWFGEHILGLFGLHPLSLSKSAGFIFLSGKASLVSISAAILLLRSRHVYFLLEFEFRGKRWVEWEHGGEDGISCLLPIVYYNCIKSEFEQIITQLRWSNKDNNKWLQGKFHWLLLSISYKF